MIRRTTAVLYRAVAAAALALTLAGPAPAHEISTSEMTGAVLDHHLQAFGAADLAALLSDYTADSVMITPNGALKGSEQIRPVFEAFLAEFAKPGASFEISQRIVEGEVAYIVWTAETADNVYELATDTFLVKDGKIAVQSFAAKVTPKN